MLPVEQVSHPDRLKSPLVKKITTGLLLVSGLLSGGCTFGLPISPLLFLLKNDPPAQREAPPSLPAPATPGDTVPDGAVATA